MRTIKPAEIKGADEPNSLGVIVITKNEEKRIERCLESVRFADQIVLVDSESTDQTAAIAKRFTEEVYKRPFDNFAAQKNFALSKIKTKWTLSIDADECVTEELRNEIRKTLSENDVYSHYKIKRKTKFIGKWMVYSGMQNDAPVRLFLSSSSRFVQPIHEYVQSDGKAGRLSHKLLHYTTVNVEEELKKTESYSDLEAQYLREKKATANMLGTAMRTAGKFFYIYFLQLGFLDGRAGLQFAYYSARYTFIKYKKLGQLTKLNQLEPQIKCLFEENFEKFPGDINRNDSRLCALINASGDMRGKKVLEVGCGKGRFSRVMVERGASMTGVDLSENLLRNAHRSMGGRFAQASASALPFMNDCFDIVYAVEVIEHLPSLELSIKEMTRVLKAGGRLIVIDRNRYSFSQERMLVPNLLIKRWHELKNDWFYPRRFPFRERWFSKKQVIGCMKAYLKNVNADYIQSDGEKKCKWHLLFDWIPPARLFILWNGAK